MSAGPLDCLVRALLACAGVLSMAGALAAVPADPVARGAYLARVGNCAACHTSPGGEAYAGGAALETPFGTFYGPNITPDPTTGIGRWTADDFWNALHHGRSRDGRLLYPSFPYANYTRVSRADVDAIFAWTRTIAPVRRENRPHELRFPYSRRELLWGWRLFYFTAGEFKPDARHDAQWNRGAYLVDGLGHCAACHAERNRFGAMRGRAEMAGGMLPSSNWYAPPLASEATRGFAAWPAGELEALLSSGTSAHGAVFGPMAAVVRDSLQYLDPDDLRAMSAYLRSLRPAGLGPDRREEEFYTLGATTYRKHCESCHGLVGEGRSPVYPPLAGNGSVVAPVAANAVRIVLLGGFPPSTAANPRPYGMPPFAHQLSDLEVAAVVSYVRQSWGNRASPVTATDIARARGVPAD